MVARFFEPAICFMMRPTRGYVKATLSTSPSSIRAPPRRPRPVDDVHHTRGKLAVLEDLGEDRRRQQRGLRSLSTTVLPVARAGASFHAAMSNGKFQGITWPATPMGRAFPPGTA